MNGKRQQMKCGAADNAAACPLLTPHGTHARTAHTQADGVEGQQRQQQHAQGIMRDTVTGSPRTGTQSYGSQPRPPPP